MNKLERLIFIACVLDEAGVTSNFMDAGITEEEFDRVSAMIEEYGNSINLKKLDKEGIEIIKELARSSRYSH